MKYLKPFNENATKLYLSQDEICVGMIGIDDNNDKSEIIQIYKAKDLENAETWYEMCMQSEHHWLYEKSRWDSITEYNLDPSADFVVVSGNFTDVNLKIRGTAYTYEIQVFQYGNDTEGKYSYWVPASEAWKKNASKKLINTSKETGILEKKKEKWLEPELVEPGMLCAYGDDEDTLYEVVKIYNTDFLKQNPKIWEEFINSSKNGYSKLDLFDLAPGWLVLHQFGTANEKGTRPKTINWYASSSNDTAMNVVHVPYSELYKKSNKLIKTNQKIGVFESKTIINEGHSYYLESEILPAEDLCNGMIGYDCYNGINVKIISTFKIGELSETDFKNLQKLSKSKWLSYEYESIEASNQPSQYVPNKNAEINTTQEFLDKNSFSSNLTKNDYLVVVETKIDINGENELGEKFTEVLPYTSDWLEVPVKEAWKKSKKLQNTNSQTGMFEKRNSLNMKLSNLHNYDKTEFIDPSEVVPGMIGFADGDINNKGEVVGIYKISDIDDETFKALQRKSQDTSGWLSYFYEKDEENKWRIAKTTSFRDLEDFLKRQPFRILSQDDYLVLVDCEYDFLGIWHDNTKVRRYDVFPYGLYDFLVPKSEYWKIGKGLKDSNDKTGIFEN